MSIARLDRTVFSLSGDGVKDWLAGLLTNKPMPPLTFAALLTPQGKIIADLFVHDADQQILLETSDKFADALEKRLKMYRLRAPIVITRETDMSVFAIFDVDDTEKGHPDPRHASLGHRMIAPTLKATASSDEYDHYRLSLGVPDSQWDFNTLSVFPADANMDLLNGVDFQKGCFVGQEVVSRMKRMTTVRKRMRGVVLSGHAKAGDKIMAGERVVGDILHANQNLAMALIRLDRLKSAEVSPAVNGAAVQVMDAVDGSGN